MSIKLQSKTDSSQPAIYQITLQGHLGREWIDWFGHLTITLQEHGQTQLTGPVADQAALHSLLRKVRDLNMPLISVVRLDPDPSDAAETKA